jgi:hypothetical protein
MMVYQLIASALLLSSLLFIAVGVYLLLSLVSRERSHDPLITIFDEGLDRVLAAVSRAMRRLLSRSGAERLDDDRGE